jgi:SAM-dependent methyltransferase
MAVALACPLCRGPLLNDGAGERCPCCGDYPRVGGVAVLVPEPLAALSRVRDEVFQGWLRLDAYRRSAALLTEQDRDATERILGALDVNQALFERVVAPALEERRGKGLSSATLPERDFRSGWSFEDLLSYFHEDWSKTRAPVRDRIVTEALLHAPRRGAALVLGCGASGLVHDLGASFGQSFGVDVSLPSLLLARRMLDGESTRCHIGKADWRGVELKGEASSGTAELVAADAAALPFWDGSFDVVITQYLLDIVPDPEALAREVNRVLTAGGIWQNDGLPFRLRGQLAVLGPVTGEGFSSFAERNGFHTTSIERRSHLFLDVQEHDPWSIRTVHEVVHAICAKTSAVPISAEQRALAAYFAGDPAALFALTPMLDAECELTVTRRVGSDGRESGATIRVGARKFRTSDEARSLVFLRSLRAASTVEQVVRALCPLPGDPGEREVILAIDALRRDGLLRLY